MPAKKAKPRKKAASASVSPIVATDPVTPLTFDEVIAEREKFAHLWYEAWRLKKIRVPLRTIGERMGISYQTVLRYCEAHEMLVAGDPSLVDRRDELWATLDYAESKMLAELAQAEAREQQKPTEDRKPVWLNQSSALLKVLGHKAQLIAPQKGKTVKVELGAAASGGSGVPGPVAAVLASVTVDDTAA